MNLPGCIGLENKIPDFLIHQIDLSRPNNHHCHFAGWTDIIFHVLIVSDTLETSCPHFEIVTA